MSGAGTRLTPDTPEMIMSRERVQRSGIFQPVLDCLKTLVVAADEMVADCGAGTGYYLHGLLDENPTRSGIALDISAAGMKRASKHPQTLALVWDLWKQLPLSSGSITTVVNVFAPRHPAEYARVLQPGGQALIVIPLPDHLHELQQHGLISQQRAKRDHVIADLEPHMGRPVSTQEVRTEVSVDSVSAADLIHMGPAGHHRTRAAVEEEIASSDVARVTVAVEVMVWTKASASAHEE
ncbi:hypothetical protein [Nesterenkonia sp. NBAIMH1]|uniref:hypothetical protein n=1 Tax=Nesterenkonia sp. NBAIMH1 TaxID=2600320 RepID=UPI001AEFCA00|nr:hypothetical protein [Nesterenkonia sp. NBAIMH1]